MTTLNTASDHGVAVVGAGKAFGARRLWAGLDLQAQPGTMTAIRGSSGSGKTTLLNAIGGLERLDSGTITVAGRNLARLGARGRRRLRLDVLGFVFQDYALIENADVEANLSLVYRIFRGRRKRAEMEAALGEVGLEGFLHRSVLELSGGERQRVALARLLLKRPSVVLADEPTGSLDEENARVVVDLLRRQADRGAAVVMVTHDASVAALCDVVVDLDAGTSKSVSRGVDESVKPE